MSDIDLIVGLHRDGPAAPSPTITNGPPVAIAGAERLDRAARLMLEHGTRHLVAVGPMGLPVGIVSTLDLARVIAAGA